MESKVYLSYEEMSKLFELANKDGRIFYGYIVFNPDSFEKSYSEYQRTYRVSSREKAFRPEMSGTSMYGSCIDGTDKGVRIDLYLNSGEWKVEKCYMSEADYNTCCALCHLSVKGKGIPKGIDENAE